MWLERVRMPVWHKKMPVWHNIIRTPVWHNIVRRKPVWQRKLVWQRKPVWLSMLIVSILIV